MKVVLALAAGIFGLLLALAAGIFGLLLGIVSVPWLILSVGYGVIGDDAAAERAMAVSPLWKWLDFVDGD